VKHGDRVELEKYSIIFSSPVDPHQKSTREPTVGAGALSCLLDAEAKSVSLTFLTTEYSWPRPPTGPTFLTFARSQTVVFLGAPSNCMQGKQGWPVASFLVVVDASSKEGDDDETCHAPATANPHRPTELPPALAHVDFINRLRQPPGRTTRTYPSLEREGVHDLTACFCCNSLVLPASKAGSLLPFFYRVTTYCSCAAWRRYYYRHSYITCTTLFTRPRGTVSLTHTPDSSSPFVTGGTAPAGQPGTCC
jgi:hypothetical protein